MKTRLDEIASGIYRVSVYIPEADFMFNQFLVNGDEPLLFHTGPRLLFPIVSQAINQVRPVEELRWITFGHLESDECGAMNLFLTAAPHAQVAHGRLGCQVNIDDLADRPPRPLDNEDVIDIGAHRLRYIATPHVPHAWDAGVYYDESTGTLLCGDLFTASGKEQGSREQRVGRPSHACRGHVRGHLPDPPNRSHDASPRRVGPNDSARPRRRLRGTATHRGRAVPASRPTSWSSQDHLTAPRRHTSQRGVTELGGSEVHAMLGADPGWAGASFRIRGHVRRCWWMRWRVASVPESALAGSLAIVA